jgi:hypothetical protein
MPAEGLTMVQFRSKRFERIERFERLERERSDESGESWRRRADSNRCIEVLQTSPLTTWVRRRQQDR